MSYRNSNAFWEEEDFLDEFDEEMPRRFRSSRVRTSAPSNTWESGRPENPYSKKRSSQNSSKEGKKRKLRTRSTAKAIDWGMVWSRFYFFFCAALVVAGCLMVLVQYMRVFSKNTEISSLRDRLGEVEDSNAVLAAAASGETMNMDALYSYATGSLGMKEAEPTDIIHITVTNQSFTTSNLPSQDISSSKVFFHWFE